MIYIALRSFDWFADICVTSQIGVTSMMLWRRGLWCLRRGVIDLGAFAYKDCYRPRAVARIRLQR